LANLSSNSLSLSLSPWTFRKPSPSDHFSISLQIKELRLGSGERFYDVNAYPAGYEWMRRRRRPHRERSQCNAQNAVAIDQTRESIEETPRHSFTPCSRKRSALMQSGAWGAPTVLPG
jgi:hypothetical protein